ncbi:MAG: hypothetical protein JXR86_20030 [Spirochaetales bacterium]|nr:hypothetical protein [Spirochaetales bacterium]
MSGNYFSAEYFHFNYSTHLDRFLDRLEYPTSYEFHMVLNVRTERGERIQKFHLNSRFRNEENRFVPLVLLKAGDATFRKLFSGIAEISDLYKDGDLAASGEVYLIGALSQALKQYYRNGGVS